MPSNPYTPILFPSHYDSQSPPQSNGRQDKFLEFAPCARSLGAVPCWIFASVWTYVCNVWWIHAWPITSCSWLVYPSTRLAYVIRSGTETLWWCPQLFLESGLWALRIVSIFRECYWPERSYDCSVPSQATRCCCFIDCCFGCLQGRTVLVSLRQQVCTSTYSWITKGRCT